MKSKSSSSSGTKKDKTLEPVKEIGQIPFALCEIVARAEAAGHSEIAGLADSIVDLLLGCGSLKVLELPQAAKQQIAGILAAHQAA
jgi:hypothetical protein